MDQRRFKVHYRGSIPWLILWTIIFFPMGLTLFLTACSFEINRTTYLFEYYGSRFWLYFWVIVFFPIAFLLLFINGLSVRILE